MNIKFGKFEIRLDVYSLAMILLIACAIGIIIVSIAK